MIEEANKISAKLRKHTVFSRQVNSHNLTEQQRAEKSPNSGWFLLFRLNLDNMVYL